MTSRKSVFSIIAVSFLLFAGEEALLVQRAYGLEVGVVTVDITPPLGMPMRGYAARKELSNGIWDPLFAKVVVLDDGATRVSIVAVDLIAQLGPGGQYLRDPPAGGVAGPA